MIIINKRTEKVKHKITIKNIKQHACWRANNSLRYNESQMTRINTLSQSVRANQR